MNKIKSNIDEVVIIEPQIHSDSRGYFFESFNQKEFEEKVCKTTFVQDNESKSSFGVLRGLHFQKPPFAQSKLVRVVKGAVLDVAVDIRTGSPTFGQHVSIELTEDNHRQFFIPRYEGAIAWDDPDLGIDWHIPKDKMLLSEKDKIHPRLKEAEWLFDYSDMLYCVPE